MGFNPNRRCLPSFLSWTFYLAIGLAQLFLTPTLALYVPPAVRARP